MQQVSILWFGGRLRFKNLVKPWPPLKCFRKFDYDLLYTFHNLKVKLHQYPKNLIIDSCKSKPIALCPVILDK